MPRLDAGVVEGLRIEYFEAEKTETPLSENGDPGGLLRRSRNLRTVCGRANLRRIQTDAKRIFRHAAEDCAAVRKQAVRSVSARQKRNLRIRLRLSALFAETAVIHVDNVSHHGVDYNPHVELFVACGLADQRRMLPDGAAGARPGARRTAQRRWRATSTCYCCCRRWGSR